MKKLLAILVVLCMVIGMLPVISFAEANTITAVRTGFFNPSSEWKLTDDSTGNDNILVSTGTSGWEAASSFTDTDGTTVSQPSLSGSGFLSARNGLVAFTLPKDLDTTKDMKVTLTMTVKNVKQVSSGARLAVYGNSISGTWSTSNPITTFGASSSNSGLAALPLLGLTSAIEAGNSQGETASGETITLSSLALTEYVKEMADEGKDEITFRLAAPMGGIRIYSYNVANAPTLTIEEGTLSSVVVKTVYYDGDEVALTEEETVSNLFVGDTYTYPKTPTATVVKGEDVYVYSAEKSTLSVEVNAEGNAEIILAYEKDYDARSFYGYEIEPEGAWCWFADPRAVTLKNEEGTIDVTVIGYIDVHGTIKATQINNLTNKVDEVLVRTNIQPDDHNNPTFIMIPDGRIVVFYSRHTDEACFWYRVTEEPGDLTTLGSEKCLATANNTTYPSPFWLSDDPEHIYLCWRGIEWHPTIAKLSLPDENGDMQFTYGPYQMVRSSVGSNVRPYAKYASNGKDKIYMSYTATHPDNNNPNWLFFNYIDINTMTLQNINGTTMKTISEGPLAISHSSSLTNVVDKTSNIRNWLWQVAVAEDGYPVIANVRIDNSKNNHDYYYVKWSGSEWVKTFLTNAGGKFHPSNTEYCYSGGMSIDVDNPNVIYCSKPVEGMFGKIWEVFKYTMSSDGKTVIATEQITENSEKNNVRPWVIPNSEGDDLRVMWMNGDYDFWMVNSVYPKGYPTRIMGEVELPREEINLSDAVVAGDYDEIGGAFVSAKETANIVWDKAVEGDFSVSTNIYLDGDYTGDILDMGNVKLSIENISTHYADNETGDRARVKVTVGDTEYVTSNVYGTSDEWQNHNIRTGGEYFFTKYDRYVNHTLTYDGEYLTLYRDGYIDLKEKIALDGIEYVNVGGFEGFTENVYVYNHALNRDEIRELCETEYEVADPGVPGTATVTLNYVTTAGTALKESETVTLRPGTDTYTFIPDKTIIVNGAVYKVSETQIDGMVATAVYERYKATGENLVPDGDFTDSDGNFSWGTWQTPRTDGGYNNGYYKDICEDWFYKVNRDTNKAGLYKSGNITAEDYALGTRWNDGTTGTCSMANFIPVEAGKTYYVAYDYKHTTAGADGAYISTAFVPTKDFAQNASGNNIPVNVSTSWQTNEFAITAEADGYIYFHFSYLGNSNNAGNGPYWYFDNFTIYELEKEAIKAEIVSVTANETVVKLENVSADDVEDIKVYVASYSANDEVTAAESKTVTVKANDDETLTFNVGGDVKVFIWDENMDPVIEALEKSIMVTMEVTSVTAKAGAPVTEYRIIGNVNGETVNVNTEDIVIGKELKTMVNSEGKTVIIRYCHVSTSYVTNIEIVEISE